MDYFAWTVALRHVRAHGRQNLLAAAVVSVSVMTIIFLTVAMRGVQRRLVDEVTAVFPHITIRQPERRPMAAWELADGLPGGALAVGRTVNLLARRQKIDDWSQWVPELDRFDPAIVGVAPVVDGRVFLSRGAKRKWMNMYGVVPAQYNRIVDIQRHLVRGRFVGLNAGELALGWKVAGDFGIQLGDKVRLLSEDGNVGSYTVAGIFDTGVIDADDGMLYIPLRDAQSLTGLGSAVTAVFLRLRQVLAANAVGDRLARRIPYEIHSWMRERRDLLRALDGQAKTLGLVFVFTTLASGFGIGSIMITMVMSRLQEIGILKAIGATRRQILTTFALEGIVVAIVGALLGVGGGSGLSYGLRHLGDAVPGGRRGEPFPIQLDPALVLGAFALAVMVGLLASLYPAWRASRVNPIDVVRGR